MPASPVPAPLTLSRRQAIKHGLAGVIAAGAAPLFLPSRLFGAGAPSNRLNIGIVGNGLMATHHMGILTSRDDCQVVALCDVWRSQMEKMRRRVEEAYAKDRATGGFTGLKLFDVHEELIAQPEIDIVFVTTPDHWHAAVANAAMKAGKDVYCEKPLTLCVREGRVLADTARRTGRILQTGTQQRSESAFRRAATIVRNGWIGEIKSVRAKLGEFPYPQPLAEEAPPADLNYDRWLGPTPWRPFSMDRVKGNYGGGWRMFWEYGGRKNGDWGAHHFDIIQWALGMDASGPVEFIPIGWEGTKYQSHRYANGTLVERVDEDQKAMIEFIGTKGRVRCGRENFFEVEPLGLGSRLPRAEEAHLYESENHHTDFFTCVRTRQQPISNVEVGHRTATVCHLNNIAQWLKRPVRWDPAREQIVGDEVAARHLDRPRRAPYATL